MFTPSPVYRFIDVCCVSMRCLSWQIWNCPLLSPYHSRVYLIRTSCFLWVWLLLFRTGFPAVSYPSHSTIAGLRRSPYTPTSSHLAQSNPAADFRSSLGSTRPTTGFMPGKLSEQKRWVEEFSKSVPHRATSSHYWTQSIFMCALVGVADTALSYHVFPRLCVLYHCRVDYDSALGPWRVYLASFYLLLFLGKISLEGILFLLFEYC